MRRDVRFGPWIGLLLLPLACSNSQASGGCGAQSNYVYPRAELAATPTPHVGRGRVTQHGLDTITAALPGVVSAMCAQNPADGTASCALNPADADQAWFYVSTQGNPTTFSGGQLRPGGHVGIDVPSLNGNLHVELIQDSLGAAIRVTVGCQAASGCTLAAHAAEWVTAHPDMILDVDAVPLLWGQSVCFVQDNSPPAPGITIQSLRFVMRPHVDPGPDGKPYLYLNDNSTDFVVELSFKYR